jgi:hypothetical protein
MKRFQLSLVLTSLFFAQSLFSVNSRNVRFGRTEVFGGLQDSGSVDWLGQRFLEEMEARQKLTDTLLKTQEKLNNYENKNNAEDSVTKTYEKIIADTKLELDRMSKSKTFGDRAMQIIFPNLDIRGMKTDKPLEVFANLVALKGLQAFSNQVEQVIDNSFNGMLTNMFGWASDKCYKGYINCYKLLTRTEGMPFDARELEIFKQSAHGTLTKLDSIAKQSARMGQRDKVSRDIDEDDSQGDPVWVGANGSVGVRGLLAAELMFIAWALDRHIPFYSKETDYKIVFYAQTMRSAIDHFVINVLNKTKSPKELSSSTNQSVILILRDSLEQSFEHLMMCINPYGDGFKKRPRPAYDNPMNRRPGRMGLDNEFE